MGAKEGKKIKMITCSPQSDTITANSTFNHHYPLVSGRKQVWRDSITGPRSHSSQGQSRFKLGILNTPIRALWGICNIKLQPLNRSPFLQGTPSDELRFSKNTIFIFSSFSVMALMTVTAGCVVVSGGRMEGKELPRYYG